MIGVEVPGKHRRKDFTREQVVVHNHNCCKAEGCNTYQEPLESESEGDNLYKPIKEDLQDQNCYSSKPPKRKNQADDTINS